MPENPGNALQFSSRRLGLDTMEFERRPLGLLAEGGDHGADVGIAGAGGEDLEAAAGGAPVEDLDVDHADAPVAHLAAVVLVEVDGVGADEGGAVVVDFTDFAGLYDLETGADGVARPIGGGAVDGAGGEVSAAGVVAAAGLCAGVGGHADDL